MNKDSRILITGGTGMVGSAVVESLKNEGFTHLKVLNSKEVDLTNQDVVMKFFLKEQFEYVIHLAAKVGGIQSNINYPVEYLYDNLMISLNVIRASKETGVKKLLNLGSSCIYPKETAQPMKEEQLLTGKLEPTNEGYALAKISALKLCEYYNKEYETNFINLMPCNLYGPKDKFDSVESHVVPALISKFHRAKLNNELEVSVWGGGNARREFLYVYDLADAIVYFMKNVDAKDIGSFVNIGFGEDVSIKELVVLVKEITSYDGKVVFDVLKPEGMMKKLLDTSKAKELGWEAKISLKDGLRKSYEWYLGKNKFP